MEWVLAEALLSQSRDPRVLLGALCRGEASAERVETLCFLLQRLEDEEARGGGGRGAGALPEAAREVAAGYLVPLLRGLRGRPAGGSDPGPPARHRRRVLRAAGAALRSCARLAGGSQLAAALAEEALRDLLAGGPAPGAEAAVEVLAAVGPCLRPREDGPLLERVAQAALALALAADGDGGEAGPAEDAAALAAGRLLPALGQCGGAALRAVWDGLGAAGAPPGPGRVGPQLLVLSALAERLLPEPGADRDPRTREEGPDARRCWRFWRTVQAGLAQAQDALTRKRARYLLQRAVEVSAELGARCACGPQEGNGPSLFWWSEKKKDELLKFWENYILIMETLEGNQIHVIKPVLPKLNSLFEYAVSEENGPGNWLFHPSWHMCIYKRMFESENKILTKEGVLHFLELYETKVLPFSPEFSEFIIGPLMDALSESSLYSRSPGQLIGSGSPLGLKLQKFLVTYISLLPEEIKNGCSSVYYDHPSDSIERGGSVLPSSDSHEFGRHGEELCDWLRVNENCFRRASDCSCVGLPEPSSLNAYVKNLVQEYMKSPALEMERKRSINRNSLLVVCRVRFPDQPCQHHLETVSKYKFSSSIPNLLNQPLGENCFMPDWFEAKLVAMMVLLAVDVEGMKSQYSEKRRTQNVLRIFLDPLLESLMKLGTNAYMPLLKTDRCLQLLVKLLHTCMLKGSSTQDAMSVFLVYLRPISLYVTKEEPGKYCLILIAVGFHLTDEVFTLLQNFVMSTAESISEFILRRLTMNELSSVSDLDRCHLYLMVLTELINLHLKVGWKRGNPIWRVISPLKNASIRHLQEMDHGQEPTLGAQVQRVISMAALATVCEATDRTPELQLGSLEAGPTERFLSALPLNHTLQKPHAEEESSLCEESSLLTSSESLCVESFDMAWKIISALSNTQLVFWSNLKAFVQFVFDTKVLTTAAKIKGQAYFKIKEIMYKIIEMSAIKTGVFNTLISYCCKSWIVSASNVSQVSLSTAKNYSELVLEACIFGTVFRRDQRLIQDVQTYIENLGHDCAANTVIENTKREDHYVRIYKVTRTCVDTHIVSSAWMDRVNQSKRTGADELVSKSRTRYYVNSQQHRVKNRIWQALLVIFPRFDQTGEENLKTSICTFLSVLSHLDIITQNVPEKALSPGKRCACNLPRETSRKQSQNFPFSASKPILKQAFIIVLQWCFSHNFSIRLYALVALKKIWSMCKTWHVEEFDALTSVIESSLSQVENMPGAGNAKKNWQRIQEHFFFETFHPLKDYCLETIFYILPRLSGLVEDEWIAIGKFTRFTDIPLDSGFQWYLSPTQLCERKPGDWAQQDIGSNSGEADDQSEWTDVQKKIIPWKNNVPDLDLELVFQDRVAKLGKSISKLIVVASLIDKPTNLGGLCRTCEVFGASALTVGSLQCTQDKQFQCLSVSAEQWLPLVEVRPPQLIDFLQQKKAEGYTVIGVEQTARSVDLTQYSFPERSLLLLGNEREGIPANLIQQLDVCVEIPQQGIIRSLNVHVSGALLIWEYTRQQLLKHGDTES
ncbi:probable methyltransferase TARBP1 isoform X6 [Prionailurus iriomotensis]